MSNVYFGIRKPSSTSRGVTREEWLYSRHGVCGPVQQANTALHGWFTEMSRGTFHGMRSLYSPLGAVLFDPVLPQDEFDALIYYHVDTVDGDHVGILDGWERDDANRPKRLIVAQGWFGRRQFIFPVETILEIDHDRRRILVTRGAVPPERPGILQRLVGTRIP